MSVSVSSIISPETFILCHITIYLGLKEKEDKKIKFRYALNLKWMKVTIAS